MGGPIGGPRADRDAEGRGAEGRYETLFDTISNLLCTIDTISHYFNSLALFALFYTIWQNFPFKISIFN